MTATTNLGKLTRIFTLFISLGVLIQTAIILYKTFDKMSEEYFIHWLYESFIGFSVLICLIDPLAQLLLYFFLEPTVQEIPVQLEKKIVEEKEQVNLQKEYANAKLKQALSKPYNIQDFVDYTYPVQQPTQLKPYQQSDQSIVSNESDYSYTQDSAQGTFSAQNQKRQRQNYKASKEPYLQNSNPSKYKAIQKPDRSGQSTQLPHILEEPTDKRY